MIILLNIKPGTDSLLVHYGCTEEDTETKGEDKQTKHKLVATEKESVSKKATRQNSSKESQTESKFHGWKQ